MSSRFGSEFPKKNSVTVCSGTFDHHSLDFFRSFYFLNLISQLVFFLVRMEVREMAGITELFFFVLRLKVSHDVLNDERDVVCF